MVSSDMVVALNWFSLVELELHSTKLVNLRKMEWEFSKDNPRKNPKNENSVYGRKMPNPQQFRPVKALTQILVKYVASFLHQMAKVTFYQTS